jgi:Glycosyl transferases group 1
VDQELICNLYLGKVEKMNSELTGIPSMRSSDEADLIMGYVENISAYSVDGWLAYLGKQPCVTSVDVIFGGEIIASGEPDIDRPDVVGHTGVEGKWGFSIDLMNESVRTAVLSRLRAYEADPSMQLAIVCRVTVAGIGAPLQYILPIDHLLTEPIDWLNFFHHKMVSVKRQQNDPANSLFTILGNSPLRVIFISATQRVARPYFDPSVRYRCYNFAHSLSRLGDRVSVISQSQFETMTFVPQADVYVFHRPGYTTKLEEKIQQLPPHAVKLADFDDLVFDVASASQTSIVKTKRASLKDALSAISKNAAALELFNNFTVSTGPLKEQLFKLRPGANVYVAHNYLDRTYADIALQESRSRSSDTKVNKIAYYSGTQSHDVDFSLIEDVLAAHLEKHQGLTLQIVGPLKVSGALKDHRQVERRNLVSYFDLIKLKADSDIVVAPLEQSVFTQCKSGLKFFEAAVLGCSIVATPIPDIQRFQGNPLLTLCSNPAEWKDALAKLTKRDVAKIMSGIESCFDAASEKQIVPNYRNWVMSL